MKIGGQHYRSLERHGELIRVIDQTLLPHQLVWSTLDSLESAAAAIRTLVVRGAPLIGVTAAYGLALGLKENATNTGLQTAVARLFATRPTAHNLRWALERVVAGVQSLEPSQRAAAALQIADNLADEDVAINKLIGEEGAAVLRRVWESRGCPARLQVATHCNAGWLGCVDWGTALAAIYALHDSGVPVHVWVDETRPVNQGSRLTAWELAAHGVPHTLQADAASGLRMQRGEVHVCIVGADRVTVQGDVCNKIGTYLLALAARDNGIPFYAALPLSTLDTSIDRGEIQIEDRAASEVTEVWGQLADGRRGSVRVAPDGVAVANPAFDITPARLLTGLITEDGTFVPGEWGRPRLTG